MSNVILPQSLYDAFLSKWQGPDETSGYVIARQTDSGLVCLISIKTGTGSYSSVQEENIEARLSRVKELQGFDLLYAHSHKISGLSQDEEEALKNLAKFRYHNSIVIEPGAVKSYHTTRAGGIRSNMVAILPDGAVFKKHGNDFYELMDFLLARGR